MQQFWCKQISPLFPGVRKIATSPSVARFNHLFYHQKIVGTHMGVSLAPRCARWTEANYLCSILINLVIFNPDFFIRTKIER